jgi:glycosyltransferase involved in cell wall biosynthesis
MIRVLHLISSSGFFGAENVLLEIVKELRYTHFLPVVGVIKNLYNPHLEITEEAKRNELSVEIFPCAGRLDLRTILLMRAFLKAQKIDIIHTHGYKSNLYAIAATLGKNISMITTCHNWLSESPKMKLYAWLDKFFLKRFDRVVAVSESVKQEILRHNISHRNLLTIYNGIDIKRFSNHRRTNSIRKEFGIDQSYKVIGFVGRLSKEKGVIYLMEAAEEVLKECPKLIFLIVGDGPLRKELQRKYDFAPIIFTGIRNDVPEVYQCMNIFVLPSLREGLPMVLLEAMASRLPVVATRVGAIPAVIMDKETGLLIEPGDQDPIKESLLYLLKNPKMAKAMGRNGYRYVQEHFSSKKMAGAYLDVYRELIQNA